MRKGAPGVSLRDIYPRNTIKAVGEMQIPEAERERIFAGNARRILGL